MLSDNQQKCRMQIFIAEWFSYMFEYINKGMIGWEFGTESELEIIEYIMLC